SNIKVVANGAGAAGIAIVKLLKIFGVREIIMCDSQGAICEGRPRRMNDIKDRIAKVTNPDKVKGDLSEAIEGADVFIGVSVAGALAKEMISNMKDGPIILEMANPDTEILPDVAKESGARVIGTGRSDYPNQVNNVLAFPGIFRGALDVRETQINEHMKAAAVRAIASLITEEELHEDYVIPAPFDNIVAPKVAKYVAEAAMEAGVARIEVDPETIAAKARELSTID